MNVSWGVNVKWIEGGGGRADIKTIIVYGKYDTRYNQSPAPSHPPFFAALPTDIQVPRWSGPRREGRYPEGVRRKYINCSQTHEGGNWD
jgi:hypothetical protein